MMLLLPFAAFIVLAILASAIRVYREYERGVVFRLGRFLGVKGPGLFFIIPIIDSVVKTDLRINVMDVEKQTVITSDNVSASVDAVVYFRVADPQKAIINVERYYDATTFLAQTTLRDILGQVDLDTLLTKREELSKRIAEVLDAATDAWGVKVTGVTIKDIALPETMIRAMAKQAEAEREKRSRIILAEGERKAAETMRKAAEEYEKVPAALRLRELQTMTEIAREKNLIVVPSGEIGLTAGLVKALTKQKK